MIHSGVPDAFFDPDAAAVERVRERYGLRRPFVLFVGTIEPRKNLDLLIGAYQDLPASTREAFELVIAGPSGWAAPETKARLRSARYLGYVPEPDLAPLTAAATVFAYPSLYEGFGFPVAQAMAAGVPVVTSNVSSLPEIAGDAALLVDPRSQAELRDALGRLLDSPERRAEMAAAGTIAGAGIPLGNVRREVAKILRYCRAVALGDKAKRRHKLQTYTPCRFRASAMIPRRYSAASWAFLSTKSNPTVRPSTTGSGWHSSKPA